MAVLPTGFRALAFLRGARAFHPRGLVFAARWEPTPQAGQLLRGSPLLAASRPAIVRLSRGVGLPVGAPDLLGLAVKLPDTYGAGRDQDLLLTSTGAGPVGRHVLRPARALTTSYSTLLPYELPHLGRRTLVAHAAAGEPRRTYAEVADGAAPPAFVVAIAGGPVLARVRVTPDPRPTDDGTVDFDPWHTGRDLVPVGLVNRLRRPTYGASRAGRRRRAARRA
ncbi:phosphodiesterase [Egicoccus halophilus]|uniref:Phosphodiesterase n=1 Tax=Egicoccus halophilus TaxID=1670830 RepID=A0A8J3A7C3_9ACTN|nr:phosphodiesterase [Egicoccus halophilus]GGI05546.1 hypothetical protein GCM10011354_14640 [Egicoccus halophilus]